jgi:hypothetical protein
LFATKRLWGVGFWLKDASRGPQRDCQNCHNCQKSPKLKTEGKPQNLTTDQHG